MNSHSRATTAGRLLIGVTILYLLACAAALALIPATGNGWLKLEPDPFVAIYAVALSLPWVLLIPDMTLLGSYAGIAAISLGMLVNLALLIGLARWLRRRPRPAGR